MAMSRMPEEPGGRGSESSALPDPLPGLVGFGRYLRGLGLPVGTGRIMAFCRAAGMVNAGDPENLFWAGRATLVSRHEDFELFDSAFLAYFGSSLLRAVAPAQMAEAHRSDRGRAPPAEMHAEVGVSSSRWSRPGDNEEAEGATAIRIVASDVEILRTKSFEQLSDDERARTSALIREILVTAPHRASRRLRSDAKGIRLDVPRTLRRSFRTEGEPFERAWRNRRTRARPLALLLDVSGSMAPYSRALLQFAFAAMAAGGRVEVFCFGTRLTRVTRMLRTKDPDRAMKRVGAAIQDWEGGTRIGESLKTLLDRWGQRSALRSAVVVLCSDGLERGDPQLLRVQMARLSRLSHKVIWVNPLKGSPLYEPLARGMAAALPFVDAFLPGHDMESLQALSEALAR
jgi:uncharacterized protein with von Willebrand factor type A (vWA) domain